jgi:hypothetical protein
LENDMPAYNFQKQFVEMILDGSKHHTVRPRRKRPTVPGDKLVLYTGQRTPQCEKIMDAVCTSVVPIEIYTESFIGVVLDGRALSDKEIMLFAERDGFNDIYAFLEFFERYPARVRQDELEVIYWIPSQPPPNIPSSTDVQTPSSAQDDLGEGKVNYETY